MPNDIDRNELFSLLRESVKANTTNAESTKAIAKVSEELRANMCQINDNFVLHNITQDKIAAEVSVIEKKLLKWIFVSIITIFTLLGGIIIAKSLGLDVVELIKQ